MSVAFYNDVRRPQELYYGGLPASTVSSASVTAFTTSPAKGDNQSSITNNSGSVTVELKLNGANAATADVLTIVLPKGTTLSATPTLANVGVASNFDTFALQDSLWSSIKTYNYPVVQFVLTAGTSGINSAAVNNLLSSIVTRDALYDFDTTDAVRTIAIGAPLMGSTCDYADHAFDWAGTGLIDATKPFTSMSVSPTET